MAKRVYFAFHYQDVIEFRANVVRKQPGALALQPVITAFQVGDGAHTREGVGHDGDGRAVARALDVSDLLIPPAVFLRHFDFRVMGMESSCRRICSASMIGVMLTCRLNLGPLTNVAGFSGRPA
jgi:hypothetical protein